MKKAESSIIFLVATGVAALAALVHLSQFTIHPWFNHLDLSHVLMAVSAYVYFLAGRKLERDPFTPTNFRLSTTIRRAIHSVQAIRS